MVLVWLQRDLDVDLECFLSFCYEVRCQLVDLLVVFNDRGVSLAVAHVP